MSAAAELDVDDLRKRIERVLQLEVDELRRLPGGASGFTFEFTYGDAIGAIARVAPPGLPPERNRDVLRQARMLTHLGEVGGVAVPRVLGSDSGDPPAVPPFFIVGYVAGDSIEPLLDPAAQLSETRIGVRSAQAAAMLAALHRVPIPPEVTAGTVNLNDEVGRWERAFETADEDLQYDFGQVAAGLRSRPQTTEKPVIIHGDWRLGNMLSVDDEVRAVIDWELWNVGDARVDLAWFELFSDPTHPLRVGAVVADAEMLRSTYAEAKGSAVEGMAWFEALVRFKQAAAAALLVKNHRRRERIGFDPGPSIHSIPVLLDAARDRLS